MPIYNIYVSKGCVKTNEICAPSSKVLTAYKTLGERLVNLLSFKNFWKLFMSYFFHCVVCFLRLKEAAWRWNASMWKKCLVISELNFFLSKVKVICYFCLNYTKIVWQWTGIFNSIHTAIWYVGRKADSISSLPAYSAFKYFLLNLGQLFTQNSLPHSLLLIL